MGESLSKYNGNPKIAENNCYEQREKQSSDPLNITNLCDDILIKIFSYLDLYEKTIILPKVCRRFDNIQLLKFKHFNTAEFFKDVWFGRGYRYDAIKLFGPELKEISWSRKYIGNKKDHYLLLNSIRMYCSNITKLSIEPYIFNDDIQKLPTSIRYLYIKNFCGKCLDLKNLTNLEILHLEPVYGSDFKIFPKVVLKNRLKEFHIVYLDCTRNISGAFLCNDLLSASDNSSLDFQLLSGVEFNLLMYFLRNCSYLKKLQLAIANCKPEEINDFITLLATKNTVEILRCDYGTYGIIEPHTFVALSKWTNLHEMQIDNCLFVKSFIPGLIRSVHFREMHWRLRHSRTLCPDCEGLVFNNKKFYDFGNFVQTLDMQFKVFVEYLPKKPSLQVQFTVNIFTYPNLISFFSTCFGGPPPHHWAEKYFFPVQMNITIM